MPSLMLHTAIAMEQTGDIKNAEAFYNGVIKKYPKSEEARDAKKNIDLIK
jgi:TolA-binding protein